MDALYLSFKLSTLFILSLSFKLVSYIALSVSNIYCWILLNSVSISLIFFMMSSIFYLLWFLLFFVWLAYGYSFLNYIKFFPNSLFDFSLFMMIFSSYFIFLPIDSSCYVSLSALILAKDISFLKEFKCFKSCSLSSKMQKY